LLVLASIGCAGSAQALPSPVPPAPVPSAAPAPTRDPSRDGMPLLAEVSAHGSLHSFEGGDDHVTFGISNRGRDVQELVIDAGGWLEEHTIAMGTSPACEVESNPDLIVCGPVYSGQQRSFSIKAFPLTPGTFHYDMRFFSREDGRLAPIHDASGVQQVIRVDEMVDAQGQQVPGYVPSPSPTR
jgi:hypothetical protein